MADNSVTLTGTLGADPFRRATTKGEVTIFSLAHSTRIRGDDGIWTDGTTSWFEVAVWGTLGKNALGSLKKGQRVLVHGTVSVNEWTTDGVKGKKAQIRATAVGHDLAFGTTTFLRAGAQRPVEPVAEPEPRAEQPSPQLALVGAGTPERPPTDWGPEFGADDDTPF